MKTDHRSSYCIARDIFPLPNPIFVRHDTLEVTCKCSNFQKHLLKKTLNRTLVLTDSGLTVEFVVAAF